MKLKGLKVAILVTDGFEQIEMSAPQKALDMEGAETKIVSPKSDHVRGWNHTDWGDYFPVDVALPGAHADDFDALLLPGGVKNPDRLRIHVPSVEFVKDFFAMGKPVAAICHAPWMVIEAGAARGRRIASWPSLKTDLQNAGATWVDEAVVADGNLVSSRKPDDLPAFSARMIDLFANAYRTAGHAV